MTPHTVLFVPFDWAAMEGLPRPLGVTYIPT